SGIVVMIDGGGPQPDGGPTMPDGGPACPPVNVPAPTTTPCAAATRTCVDMAATGNDVIACLQGDPMANACLGCVDQALSSCATMNGCNDEYGQIDCCVRAACPTLDSACVQAAVATMPTAGACASQATAFQGCLTPLLQGGTCPLVPTGACFMP
ncbi:MAG: hypothetical protein K8H88_30960, partial [Sandaracinaceae bacterium]|nr:hypothetical protein [Sandaracinaceae bacterium]